MLKSNKLSKLNKKVDTLNERGVNRLNYEIIRLNTETYDYETYDNNMIYVDLHFTKHVEFIHY